MKLPRIPHIVAHHLEAQGQILPYLQNGTTVIGQGRAHVVDSDPIVGHDFGQPLVGYAAVESNVAPYAHLIRFPLKFSPPDAVTDYIDNEVRMARAHICQHWKHVAEIRRDSQCGGIDNRFRHLSGATAQVIREMLPDAYFATVYAKPEGRPLVDAFVRQVSQDTWIRFPWDMELNFAPPMVETLESDKKTPGDHE